MLVAHGGRGPLMIGTLEGVIEVAQTPGVPSGFQGLPLDHNRSAQRSSRITAKYFIKSIIQQLPWEAKSKRVEKMMVRVKEREREMYRDGTTKES